jgi:hypothetical protein
MLEKFLSLGVLSPHTLVLRIVIHIESFQKDGDPRRGICPPVVPQDIHDAVCKPVNTRHLDNVSPLGEGIVCRGEWGIWRSFLIKGPRNDIVEY